MPRRTKRAAAATAARKIRKAIEESMNADKIGANAPQASKAHSTDSKRKFTDVFDFDGVAPDPKRRRAAGKKDERACPPRRRRAANERNVEPKPHPSAPVPTGIHETYEGLLYSSDSSLASTISSSSSESTDYKKPSVLVEISTVEQARMEHQRRRSIRSINSAGPMLLSLRTSYRITKNCASPAHSPITSTRLRFTPCAHFPTTPIIASSGMKRGVSKGWRRRSSVAFKKGY